MLIKQLVFSAVVILSSTVALACPDKDGDCKDGQCKHKKNDIVTLLKLDAERADKVRDIQKSHKAEMQAAHAETKAKMAALHEQHMSDLSAVLTASELEQVQTIMADRKGDHHGEGHHGHVAKDGEPRQCKH